MSLRFLSYNILDGGGAAGERLELLQGVLGRLRPDVLGLMECNGFERSGMRTLFAWERALGMRGVLCETRTGYHVALFVRDARVIEIHRTTDWFHHGALRARLEIGGRELTAIAAHLCPFSGESRVREAQYLATHVRGEPLIVMGDMNAISRADEASVPVASMPPRRRARHVLPGTSALDTRAMDVMTTAGLTDLFRHVHPTDPGATLSTPLLDGSPKPELRVDYLFGSQALAAATVRCEVVIDDETRRASDHFPVLADVET